MSQQHVLIAEDEWGLRDLLVYNLGREGFRTTACDDGETAANAIRSERPDLALLDWMLPRRSGIEVCREVRANPTTASLPVIMLTARSEVDDRVVALDSGADDYVIKPFSMAELVSRVRAVLRRVETNSKQGAFQVGDILLDVRTRRVERNGKPVHLGPKEFGILECLMQEPGRVFSREDLLEAVWGRNAFVDPRTVDVNVNRLRRALGVQGGNETIRTVRLGGYALGRRGGSGSERTSAA